MILTTRDENQGLEAVQNLKARGQSDILFHQLDVTNETSIASLAKFIKTKFKKLDILVVLKLEFFYFYLFPYFFGFVDNVVYMLFHKPH